MLQGTTIKHGASKVTLPFMLLNNLNLYYLKEYVAVQSLPTMAANEKKEKKYQKGFPHYCFSFLSKDSRRLGLVKIFNTWSPKHTGHISTQNQNKQKTKWWVRSSVFSECTHPRHQQDKSQLGKHKNSCFLPQVIVIYSSCFTAAR